MAGLRVDARHLRPAWPARVGISALVAMLAGGLGIMAAAVGAATHPAVVVIGPALVALALGLLRWPSLAAAGLYLSFPFAYVSVPLVGDFDVELVELTVLGVAAVVVLRRLSEGLPPLEWSPVLWWAAAFLGATLIASSDAASGSAAVKQLLLYVGGVLTAVTVMTTCRRASDIRRALLVLAAVGGSIALFAIDDIGSTRLAGGGTVITGRATGMFNHGNALGGFAAMVLVASTGVVLASRTTWQRVVAGTAGVAAAAALAASLSRGAWIGAAAGFAVLLLVLPEARRATVRVVVPAVIAGAAVAAVVPDAPPPALELVIARASTFDDATDNPDDHRRILWREALRQVRDEPWTGQGPGNFGVVATRAVAMAPTVAEDHPHNQLLTLAAENGLPATVLAVSFALAVAVTGVRIVRRLSDPSDRATVATALAILAVDGARGSVEFTLRNPLVLVLLASAVGLVLAAARAVEEGSARGE